MDWSLDLTKCGRLLGNETVAAITHDLTSMGQLQPAPRFCGECGMNLNAFIKHEGFCTLTGNKLYRTYYECPEYSLIEKEYEDRLEESRGFFARIQPYPFRYNPHHRSYGNKTPVK